MNGDQSYYHLKIILNVSILNWSILRLTQWSQLVWNLHEQICVAALELGDYGVAESTINTLAKQFTSSHRVNRLRGMLLEAQGNPTAYSHLRQSHYHIYSEKYDEARELYDQILKADASNTAARKRKVRGNAHHFC